MIGAVVEALNMRADAARLTELLRSSQVTTVTLTVTEKGYSRRPDGGLDTAAPGVGDDLAATAASRPGPRHGRRTAVPASLAARFRAGGAPIDVVSCDNTAGNGAALARVVREFVEASAWRDRDAGARLARDRRSASRTRSSTGSSRPRPSADRDGAAAALGVRDEMAVVGEPYRQWVLQDAFVAARPRWEIDGALVVPDVAPYQLMKLRLLNGSHSAMAYLGAAAGCTTVADVLATEWGEPLVRAFGAEVAPTLPDAGLDAGRYVDDLVARFRNPAMQHLLRQIGSDGSLKIPERWFPALRDAARGARRRRRCWSWPWPAGSARPGRGRAASVTARRIPPRRRSTAAGRTRPTRRPWSRRCCAPSAPTTSPSRRTSPRPSPPGSRLCAPDRST